MEQKKIVLFILITHLAAFLAGCSGNKNSGNNDSSDLWNKLSSYFRPPAEYENVYGNFRSPLLYYNGDTVRTVEDWQRRRTEIKDRWMSLLGQWPPVITGQTFEILDTLHRENFMQYRVRFYWTPNEQTEGYLLVPDKEGKKPAVITTFYEPETAIGLGGKPYRDFAYQLTKRGFVTLSIGTTKTTENQTYSIYYPTIEKCNSPTSFSISLCSRKCMGSISQSTGRRFYKNRHHRAFLWWEVGNVCLMPIRKVRLCGMGRPRNCIRRNKRGIYQLLGTLVFGILSATMGKYMEQKWA